MHRRLHVALLLAAFFCVFWLDLPDAVAPLILAIPFFAMSVISRGGFHSVDFAAGLGVVGLGLAIAALLRPGRDTLLVWTRVVLATSVAWFVVVSRPMWQAALSAIPFAVLAVWLARKSGPNKSVETTRGVGR